ncbi:fumarylacetoacetate hydrolase family protein, partial [Verrucomicrobiota bacterium]
MRLSTYVSNGEQRLGIWRQNNMIDFHQLLDEDSAVPGSMLDLLRLPIAEQKDWLAKASCALQNPPKKACLGLDESQVQFAPPVVYPAKLICLGGNYQAHIDEFDRSIKRTSEKQKYPLAFLKSPTNTLIGHCQPILIQKGAMQIDWEAELAVVIGKRAKHQAAANALDCVFGYSILNDVSDREFQINHERHTVDFFRAKNPDTFAPMGPWIVTADEIPDIQDLSISLRVNGVTKQDANTNQMISSVAKIIEFVSSM